MSVVSDLGPVRLDDTPIDHLVGSPTQRLLFVALVVEHPEPVSADRLTEVLWPGESPRKRRLWDTVHRLRHALDAEQTGIGIVRAGEGYALEGPISADSRRFDALVEQADASLQAAPLEAIQLADAALALWRGPPYEGHDLGPLAPGAVARLTERRLRAVVIRAQARLAVDEPATVVGELDGLIDEYPFDEELILLLATALGRSGRKVAALRRLRQFEQDLADQVGLGPSPRLAALESQLLTTIERPVPDAPVEPDDLADPAEPVADLPRWRTSFIGRSAASTEVRSLIADRRLITIVGPAGVGKTRLAVESVRGVNRPPGGVHFVDLATTSDPSSVDAVFATAFGIRDPSPRDSVTQLLGRSRSIVVVDNCEHLAEAASELIDHLLDRTATTTLVATSRAPLRLDGETVFRLDPLGSELGAALSPAAQLFCERAGLDATRLSAEHRRSVEEIAVRLDGLPLAIELAAARAGSLSLADLADGLDARYQLLTSGQRGGPDRHRTLRGAVDWSYEQLQPEQQAVLSRASVFAGRFTLDDAAGVCSDPTIAPNMIRSTVADLVDASLITLGQSKPPYRLLETLRQYGTERLEADGERAAWARRHGAHFADRAARLAEQGYGPGERAAIDEVMTQSDEYRAAIQALLAAEEWELLSELVWNVAATVFTLRGTWMEPMLLVADVALRVPDPMPRRWPGLLSGLASVLYTSGRFDEAERHASLAIELAPDWYASWVGGAGRSGQRNPVLAVARGEKAISLSDPDRPNELLSSITALTIAKRTVGDTAGALEGANRLVSESLRFGTRRGESVGWLQVALASPTGATGAAQAGRRAFELGQQTRTRLSEVAGAMAHVRHLLAEDLDRAGEALDEYLRLPILRSPIGPWTLGAAAAYFALTGDVDIARRLVGLLGQNNLANFVDHPAVASLASQAPPYVDPATIPAEDLEAMNALALERLQA